jgi:putative ABC transport system permease protein
MIKSILLSALRNMFRNRSFSLINLIGLSISMSLGLLIILVIKSQNSFDTFHTESDKIYRINTEALRTSGGGESYASVPLAIPTALHEEFAFTDQLVRLDRQFNGEVKVGRSFIRVRGLFVDPAFLDVFNFPLQRGNVKEVLLAPNSVVLTQQASEKLFGTDDPVGKVFTVNGYGEFTVTGVLKPFVGPTHFEFEALVSMSSVPVLAKDGIIRESLENVNNYYSGYAYVKLKDGISVMDVEEALSVLTKKYYADVKFETRDKGYRFYLQSLNEITPGPILSNNMGTGMPKLLLIFMSVLAGIVMLMACFNYTQLMIAKSLTRAREIGVRKIVGAHRWQVFVQFVGEAMVFSLAALILAYLLLQLIKPAFLQLHLTQEFTVDLQEDYTVLLVFIFFAIIIGGIAGLLPAGYLSAFKPLKVLRGAGDLKVYARLTFRKVLMVAQFTLSLIFILLVITIYRQVNFMLDADYGFNQQNLVNIRLGSLEYEKLRNELNTIPGVERVGGVSHSLGTWADGASDYKRNFDDELFVMRDFAVDENYLRNMEITLLAGRHFDAGVPRQVILNQTALNRFGFDRPVDAVGQLIYLGDSTQLTIVGVVRDFHFRPLNYQIGPLVFRYDPESISILTARVTNSNDKVMLAKIESVWRKLDSRPFEWMTVSYEIDKAYEDAGFFDVLKIVGYITVVAIVLACLGILGMAMYMAQTRTKEIGVRKVMGANVTDILFLLSRSFLILIGVAVLIGVPISYLLGGFFLDTYAYKVSITPWVILFGVLFLVLLAFITISSQTIRAATINPVKSLRYE